MPECGTALLCYGLLSRVGRFGTQGLAITSVRTGESSEVLKRVQQRLEVNIGEMPKHVDTTSDLNA